MILGKGQIVGVGGNERGKEEEKNQDALYTCMKLEKKLTLRRKEITEDV